MTEFVELESLTGTFADAALLAFVGDFVDVVLPDLSGAALGAASGAVSVLFAHDVIGAATPNTAE